MAAPISRAAYRFMTEQGLIGEKTERIEGAVIGVANTSLELDRDEADVYARGNVPRYLIVNLKENEIEDYSLLVAGSYTRKEIIRSGELSLWPDAKVDLKNIFR